MTADGTNLYIYRDGSFGRQPGGERWRSYNFNNPNSIYIGANSTEPGAKLGWRHYAGGVFQLRLVPRQILQLWTTAQGIGGPGILTQPASESVLLGQPAGFSVEAAAGTPPYTYQWYKSPAKLTGATNTTSSIASGPGERWRLHGRHHRRRVAFGHQPAGNPFGADSGGRFWLPISLVMSMGPIAYYPFNETSGTNATDIVGGHNGFFVNSTNDVTPGGATGPVGVAAKHIRLVVAAA